MKESEILKNYDRTSKDVLAMESADSKEDSVPTMNMEDSHIEESVQAEATCEVIKDEDDRCDGSPTRELPEIEPELDLTGEMDIGGLDH